MELGNTFVDVTYQPGSYVDVHSAPGIPSLVGPKGDPGGWVAPTVLADGTDLDTVTTPGTYVVPSAIAANGLAAHYPVANFAGGLTVYGSSGQKYQTATFYNRATPDASSGQRVWMRVYHSTLWGAWFPLHTPGGVGGGDAVGTGSPEGVLAAPVGTYYTDTAGTNGAWRWLKKAGTGNTGWAVVDGDTGFRDITGTLPATLTAGKVLIRRTGTDVHIVLDGLMWAGGTAPYNVLPAGIAGLNAFSPKAVSTRQMLEIADSPGVMMSDALIVYMSGGVLYIRHQRRTTTAGLTLTIPATPAGTTFNGEVRWSTAAAWPTSLPGT